MLKILLKAEEDILVNIYGPNHDNKLVHFYHSVLQSTKTNDFDTDNIIMGDFNCPLTPIVHKRGGNLRPRQSVINTIERLHGNLICMIFGVLKIPQSVVLRGVNQIGFV